MRIRALLPRFVLDFVDPVGPFVGDTLRFPALRSLRFVPSVIRNRDVRRSRRDWAPAHPFNWITVAFLSSILSRRQGEILLTRLLAISSALFDAISIKREIKATPTRHYHVTPWLLLASSPFPVPFSPPHTRSKRASFSPRISVRFVLRASGI